MTLPAAGEPAPFSLPGPRVEGEALGTPFGARLVDALLALSEAPLETWRDRLAWVGLADVAPFARFDATRYTRTLLAATLDVEARLMGWLPGQASPIHDHGGSRGMMRVLAGGVEEDVFDVDDGFAVLRDARRAWAGDSLMERPLDVHRVRAGPATLALTLHVYAPRLDGFRTFPMRDAMG